MTDLPHVLIVEDNELVAGAMRILFESADWRVSTELTIAGALGAATHDPAQLVLLDLTLPDGDGLTLVATLRAAGSTHFVALTGRDDPETRKRCIDAGCADVFVKPVPVRELLARTAVWRS